MAAPNLASMPVKIWEKLLVGVDFESVQSLRKVSSTIRAYIDEAKPEANLYDVTISAQPDFILLDLRRYDNDTRSIIGKKIVYQVHAEGCLVTCGRNQKLLKGQTIEKIAAGDLFSILKLHKGTINHFHVELPFSDPKCEILTLKFNNFYLALEQYLKSRKEMLKVSRLHMEVQKQVHVTRVLAYLEPKALSRISLCKWSGRAKLEMYHKYGQYKDFEMVEPETVLATDKVVKLEQWKACPDVYIDDFIVESALAKCLVFTKASIMRKHVTRKNLKEAKKIILASKNFKELYLRFTSQTKIKDTLKAYGTWNVHENGVRSKTFPWPHSNDHVLKVTYIPNEYFLFTLNNIFSI